MAAAAASASTSNHPSIFSHHQEVSSSSNQISDRGSSDDDVNDVDDQDDINHVHPLPAGPRQGQGELRLGAYHIPKPSECLMEWQEICQFIATGDLDDLKRHPRCESEYAEWAAPIRKKWGSLESYIRSYRLAWQHDQIANSQSALDSSRTISRTQSQGSQSQVSAIPAEEQPSSPPLPLCFDAHMDHNMVKCIPNDWPYAIPRDCAHYVVWCQFPIIDLSLFSTPPESSYSSTSTSAAVSTSYSAPNSDPFDNHSGTPHASQISSPASTLTVQFPTDECERARLYECVVQDGVRGLTGQSNTTTLSLESPRDREPAAKEYQVIGLATVSSLLKSPGGLMSKPSSSPASVSRQVQTQIKADSEISSQASPEAQTQTASTRGVTLVQDQDQAQDQDVDLSLKSDLNSNLDMDLNLAEATSLAALAHRHAGRHIDQYVRKQWNERDWQTAWFCNPPHLRTVPGLSHFHVIARKRRQSLET